MFPALDSAICVWSCRWASQLHIADKSPLAQLHVVEGVGAQRPVRRHWHCMHTKQDNIYTYIYICIVYTDYEKQVWNLEPKPFQSPTPTHIASHLASHRSKIDENCVHLSSFENSFSSTTWGDTSWEKPREIMDNMENRHIIGIEEKHKWGPKRSDSANLISLRSNFWNLWMLALILLGILLGSLTRVSS